MSVYVLYISVGREMGRSGIKTDKGAGGRLAFHVYSGSDPTAASLGEYCCVCMTLQSRQIKGGRGGGRDASNRGMGEREKQEKQ